MSGRLGGLQAAKVRRAQVRSGAANPAGADPGR